MKLRFVILGFVCSMFAVQSSVAEVRWESFELPAGPTGLRAQLGRLTVPLVRSAAGSGSVELAFVRLQAGEGSAGSPIIYLPGGPGGSGIGAARSLEFLASFVPLAALGDVILLDPRGVGRSTPRPVCPSPRPIEPHEKFADPSDVLPVLTANAIACVEQWRAKGVDVLGFTNRESAADLEDLRKALGAKRVSLIGFSYGTHLALSMLHEHPSSIDRMVLVATEGPNHTRKFPFTLDRQLAKLSILAGVDMNGTLARVLAALAKKPVLVTVTDRARKSEVEIPIGPAALQRILSSDIGDGNDFTVFPALLATLERGDPSILAWFVEKRYNQISGGTNLMLLGMECSSGATPNRQREIAGQAGTSLFGNAMNFPFPDICAALPGIDLGDTFRRGKPSNVPVLFVSGTLDSNTPPFQAEEVRWAMPRSTHLIVENAGHEDTLPIPEVQMAIVDFLAGKDVAGRHIALPPPKFLSVEEAKKDRAR